VILLRLVLNSTLTVSFQKLHPFAARCPPSIQLMITIASQRANNEIIVPRKRSTEYERTNQTRGSQADPNGVSPPPSTDLHACANGIMDHHSNSFDPEWRASSLFLFPLWARLSVSMSQLEAMEGSISTNFASSPRGPAP
jgi:hypothetical protein